MAAYNIKVNGKKHQLDVESDTPILWVLRDHLKLVGTKYGCSIPISAVGEMELTTIEGLSEKGDHPVQKAWLEHDVPQCGYCQSGQIMNASAFLQQNPNPTKKEIAVAMNGNICRCGTYTRINKAVETAAKNL
jgi:isoquinoline 1-oxidoreductase alpha subunit